MTLAGLVLLLPCVAAAPPPGLFPNALPPSFYGFSPSYYGPYLPGHYQYGNVNPSVYGNSTYSTLSGYGRSNNVPVPYSAQLWGSSSTGSSPSGYLPSIPSNGYGAPYFIPPAGSTAARGNTQVLAEVHLPKPDAELWVEGRKTGSTGTWRWFVSPPLVPGDRYAYDFHARWYENGREVVQDRHVSVRPGEPIIVDFTRPAKAEAAPAAKSS
jgi:uncharacterized protein (TIGR03000 family)